MTDIEKAYFLHGYIYRLAEEAKERDLFSDFSIKEVMEIFIKELEK